MAIEKKVFKTGVGSENGIDVGKRGKGARARTSSE
jgi:hypothetical protein